MSVNVGSQESRQQTGAGESPGEEEGEPKGGKFERPLAALKDDVVHKRHQEHGEEDNDGDDYRGEEEDEDADDRAEYSARAAPHATSE